MHRRHNGLKTAVLLGGLSALILVIGSWVVAPGVPSGTPAVTMMR